MSRFELDRTWITEELYLQPELTGLVKDTGEAILSEAIRLATRISVTGDFARSIKGELLRGKNNAPFYRVWSNDPGAISIEFGTSKTNKPAHRVLGQAIGKWHDVNTHRGPIPPSRRSKKGVEKSIDQWVASVLKRG